jgi:hypothetical protein
MKAQIVHWKMINKNDRRSEYNEMGLYCVEARHAVPLHDEAATVSLTATMPETMIKTTFLFQMVP